MKVFPNKLKNEGWTLFLDRDGVINKRPLNAYVTRLDEFIWEDGAIESITKLSEIFNPIIVVTNQQGVGKGIMTRKDINVIHNFMLNEINRAGGRIDKVYFCGDMNNSGSLFRKPAIGMGLWAKKDFPEISFKNTVMVGDTITDMMFGKRLNMLTVLVDKQPYLARKYPYLIDYRFNDLKDFTEYIYHSS
jgi:histidinol-phosphate phosphatase family protein